MPLYEYRCAACGKVFEQLRRMADADCGLICPECASANVTRLVSTFATSGCNAPAGSRFS